jgi:hypothetical protein
MDICGFPKTAILLQGVWREVPLLHLSLTELQGREGQEIPDGCRPLREGGALPERVSLGVQSVQALHLTWNGR